MNQVEMITLGNGTIIPLEEFFSWNYIKQTHALRTPADKAQITNKRIKTHTNTIANRTLDETAILSQNISLSKSNFDQSWSEERRTKFSDTIALRTPISKPLCTPKGIFITKLIACIEYNVHPGTMQRWMNNKPDLFYYIKKD